MNGLTTVFEHKKWVFTYVIIGLSFWQLEGAEIAQILTLLCPAVLGASSFDKSQWRKE